MNPDRVEGARLTSAARDGLLVAVDEVLERQGLRISIGFVTFPSERRKSGTSAPAGIVRIPPLDETNVLLDPPPGTLRLVFAVRLQRPLELPISQAENTWYASDRSFCIQAIVRILVAE